MRTLTKMALIFTVALLSMNAVKAQKPKVDKKAARMAAYQKMIDTANWTVVMEKAFPKPSGASAANQVTISGAPVLSVSHGVAECDLPYYGSDAISTAGLRVKFTSTHFDYSSDHTPGSSNPYQYNILITPKPGATDMNNVEQIILSIANEDVVQVQVNFVASAHLDPVSYQGYIIPYKKQD